MIDVSRCADNVHAARIANLRPRDSAPGAGYRGSVVGFTAFLLTTLQAAATPRLPTYSDALVMRCWTIPVRPPWRRSGGRRALQCARGVSCHWRFGSPTRTSRGCSAVENPLWHYTWPQEFLLPPCRNYPTALFVLALAVVRRSLFQPHANPDPDGYTRSSGPNRYADVGVYSHDGADPYCHAESHCCTRARSPEHG